MNRTEKVAELRDLQAKVDAMRQELEFEPPGKVTFMAPLDVNRDDTVIGEADGFGGATLSVVEGNYPIDYITKFEKFFQSEKEAEAAAEKLSFQAVSPARLLEAPA